MACERMGVADCVVRLMVGGVCPLPSLRSRVVRSTLVEAGVWALVFGLWAGLLGLLGVAGLDAALEARGVDAPDHLGGETVYTAMFIVAPLLVGITVAAVVLRVLLQRHVRQLYFRFACAHCGYSFRGLDGRSTCCPECGRAVPEVCAASGRAPAWLAGA